jgi:hypothetical protein
MALYITQIGRHKFVCGLFWQSLSRPRELAREAADLGRKIEADLMVIRTDHSTTQAGFGHSKEGARRGMYSLATVVSKTLALEGAFYDGEQQQVHNWLGAFALPDGQWVYFAVRDANFLPNGDFAGSREEVLERLHSDYALGGWNVVIGDAGLASHGFHNFNPRDIDSFIPKRKDGSVRIHRWWALRQIDGARTWLPMAAAAGVALAVALGGVAGWRYYQHKKQAEADELAFQAARANLLRASSAASHPWAHQAPPRMLVAACQRQFTHPTAGGWRLDSYGCTAGEARYAWSRADSTVAMLREQIPAVVVDIGGDKATFASALNGQAGSDDGLLDQRQLIEPLLTRFQAMGLPFRVTQADARPAQAGEAAAPPPWKSFSFALNSHGVEPMEIATILNRPGVRVDKMVYRASEWLIEGTIYAK